MSIARRAYATGTNPASSSSFSANWSTIPTNGDMLLAVIGSGVQATITPPAGWTLLGTQDAGSALRSWLYTRTASSEPTSDAWSLSSATKGITWMGAYSGVDPTTLVFASVAGLNPPSLAVPANGWLVAAGTGRHTATGAAATWSSSDGSDLKMLDFGSNVGAGNDIDGCVFDSNRPLAATTYSRTLTPTIAESIATGFLIAFGPTGGGGDTTPPTAPPALAAGTPTTSTIPLTWTAATDNVAVTGYQVYRGATLVTTVAGTSYTDTGLAASTSYTYTVKAIDAASNVSVASSPVTATTAAGGIPKRIGTGINRWGVSA